MMQDTEAQFVRMVMRELAHMASDQKPIRLSWNAGTETHRQLLILSAQKQVEPRTIVEAAVRVFFTAWMRSNYEQPNN
jgi:hypothetical protein